MHALSVDSGASHSGVRVVSRSARNMAENQLTVRAVVVGLLVGLLMCGTNMYFGLQSG